MTPEFILVVCVSFYTIRYGQKQARDVVGYLLFVYGAALVGTYACHRREREFRYSYLHKRILKDNKVHPPTQALPLLLISCRVHRPE